jgi:steroid 5-alpha reductase family enzyme
MHIDIGKGTIAPYFLHVAPCVGFLTILSDLSTYDYAMTNAVVQTFIFIVTAQIPAYKTGIMSWVDLAWPTGLVAIAIQTFFNANTNCNVWRVGIGALMYLFQGGRMALGATNLVLKGHMSFEMPRYQYQKLRWKERGILQGSTAFTLMMQKEIFMQALANMGSCVIPSVLIARNKLGENAPLEKTEYVGILCWILSYLLEHTSDLQKVAFLKRMKKQGVLNASMTEKFWSLSRHPNYLGEWLVWVSLSLFAVPSLRSFLYDLDSDKESVSSTTSMFQKILLPLSLAFTSMSMYFCLTWWTGAVPAEYFSADKRTGYAQYQKNVPILIPKLTAVINYLFSLQQAYR